jgi:hypothetical protein
MQRLSCIFWANLTSFSLQILFEYVRRGGGYEAVPWSAALLGPAAAPVADRAGAQGWRWRDAQAAG